MTPAELQTAAAALVAKHGVEKVLTEVDKWFSSDLEVHREVNVKGWADGLVGDYTQDDILFHAALLAARAQERERIIKLMEYYETHE